MIDDRALYEEALQRGHSYSWDQQWQQAIEEFQRATKAAANEPAAYAGLGMAYYELGKLEDALENYKLASRYSRGDMIYLKHVADVQERLGQLSDAGQTYMAVGEILLRRKRLDEAVGNWLRAVRLDPNLIGGHQRLAAVYRRQGLTRNAIREYLAMARIFYSKGDRDQAIRVCQAALEIDPRNKDVLTAVELIRRGEDFLDDLESVPPVKERENDLGETLLRMTSALKSEGEDWQLGTRERRYGLLEGAVRMAQRQLAGEIFSDDEDQTEASVIDPGMSKLERDALLSQALDFQTRGSFDEAISCFEQAIAGGVDNVAAHFCLGILYMDKQRLGEAIRQLGYTLEDETYRLAGHFALGEAYRLHGEMNPAIKHYVHALRNIDLSYIPETDAERVSELYDRLSRSILSEGDIDSETRFIDAFTDFVGYEDWEERVESARKSLDRLSRGRRIMILGEMLTAGSTNVLESLYLSQVYSDKGQFETAVEEAYRAIQLSPFYMPAHIQLGELMARQERIAVAVAKFSAIGDTYRVRGDIESALNSYERVIELAPMELEQRARLIDLLLDNEKYDRALEHYVIMGEAFYNLAEVDKARKTYLEALKLASHGSAEHNWRSRLLKAIADIDMQRLDWKRALMAYHDLQANDPNDDEVALTLIDLYFKVGKPQGAINQLDRYLIGLVRSGRGSEVIGVLEELAEQRPAEEGLAERLVRLYKRMDRYEDAIRLLDKLGEAQLDAGETQKAIRTIEALLELNPPNKASYRQLLQSLYKKAI